MSVPDIPFVDLLAQHKDLMPNFIAALETIVHTSSVISGPALEAFERAFADYHGIPFAIGCSSGTDALILAARALDLKPGDEVITVPNTWISTVFSISMTGARPVFVDVDPHTHQIDAAAAAAAITPRTKAIFAVHMFGHPANLTELASLCRWHGLAMVEDVAQSIGARHDGELAGTVGDIGCFSFFPSKNLGCLGDGGAMVTRDKTLAQRLRRLGQYGQDQRYIHEEIGYNARLDTLQAAFLLAKLPRLDDWNAQRRALAARYKDLLQGLDVSPPFEHPAAKAVYHLYVIQVASRDACLAYLREHGVLAQLHYPHLVPYQPCYASLGYKPGDFPVAEKLNKRILSLPLYPGMTEEQQDRVVATLTSFLNGTH